jgi:murein DD-endopeptidase MepM/ murein hydrolase activator NlpD
VDEMETKNDYRKPVKKYYTIRRKAPAHKGNLKNAVDFLCDEGTPIYAASSGKAVFVKQDSNIGGPNKKYWFDGNRIVLKHKNDKYTAYEHLKFRGSKIKVGQNIRKGQLIGYSGNTGFTSKPHLHFELFKFTGPDKVKDFQTLKIKFKG